MKTAGIATEFEQAEAALQENWSKWLAWANLQEVSGPTSSSRDPASRTDSS
jgi:hypothetical protein